MNYEKGKLRLRDKIIIAILLGILAVYLLTGIEMTLAAFCVFVAILAAIHLLLKLSTIFKPYSEAHSDFDPDHKPFVSIHVACKNEPARIVNQTLEVLSKLDYPNYEVLVIHSNNMDVENYQKIEKFSQECGDHFKFVHLDQIAGFKAGALNHLNQNYLSDKVEIIAVVDCDYLVDSDFLNKTAGYFRDPQVGIVQVPQSYYNVDSRNIGLFYEYRSFFSMVMHQTQRFDLVTFTGTMGLIRADLMNKGLAWNEWCITEDSEAGIYINILGYKGIYVDEELGKGLMPFDYASLSEQRRRWSYGNMQILMKDFVSVLTNRFLSLKQKLAFMTLLTTWLHFELLISVLYLGVNLLILTGLNGPEMFFSADLMLVMLAASYISNFVYFAVGMRKEIDFKTRIKAFLSHYGLICIMSSSWIKCLFGQKLDFIVTNKEKTADKIYFKQYRRELIILILLFTGLGIKVISGYDPRLDLAVILPFAVIELSGIMYLLHSFLDPDRSALKRKEHH